jgi:hypothetical protein
VFPNPATKITLLPTTDWGKQSMEQSFKITPLTLDKLTQIQRAFD